MVQVQDYPSRKDVTDRDDASFRACLCTLLLLLALFGTISIFLWLGKTPMSYKVLNNQPSSDSSSLFGKIIKNEPKTSASLPHITTQSSETTSTSVHVATENKRSTSSLREHASTIETTEESNPVDNVSATEMEESSLHFTSPATEPEETFSSLTPVKTSTEYSPSTTKNDESSNETGETLTFMNSKGTTSSESTAIPNTNIFNSPSLPQDTSTEKLFEKLMNIDETTEPSTTERGLKESSDVGKSTSTNEETTSEHITTLLVETPELKESIAVDTTPEITRTEAATSTSTPLRSTTTTARVTSPPLTCPHVTCPESSCPECPEVTCPTIPTTTVTTTTVKPEVPVCQSNQCHVVAARILSLVNVTVDPCEDFYSYACGGILNNPTLLEDDLATDVLTRIEKAVKNISSTSPASHQKLKNFYNGCVNYDKLMSMEERKKQGRKVLDSVAVFADASSSPDNDFTDLLIRLFQHGSRPLLDLWLDVDSSNSSQFQLVVTVPNWLRSPFYDRTKRCKPAALPAQLIDAYEDYKHCMGNFSEFLDTTQKALEFFGVFEYLSAYNASQLIQEIRMSMEFDVLELLREYPLPDMVNKITQTKTYKLTPKIQLETELPMISWSYLFSSLLKVEVSDAANVQVYFIDHLKKFFGQLQTKSVRTVHNSLLAMFTHDLYVDLALTHQSCDRERYCLSVTAQLPPVVTTVHNSLLAMFAHDLYVDLVLTHQSCDRERYCLSVTAQLLPVVTSNLYLETFPAHEDRELRKQVVLTYQHLETAMEDKISKATWLDEKTSNEISKKLKFMSIQLPRKFNNSRLDSSLGECTLEGRHYFNDSVCLVKQLQSQLFSRYTLDPHSAYAMWPHFLTPFSTETAFIYGLNTFMIPLAVIRPVYDPRMPRHVVMATLGNILARGIGHNFDHTGVKFQAGGKIGMMLSEATNPTYEAVVGNSNMQFSWTKSYREDGKIYSYLLEPELTLNQRLSDITAVNLSLSTVLDSSDTVLPWTPFSPAQTYFLALAQSFCSKKKMPHMFTELYEGTSLLPFDRVFNLAANSEQFALAFRCPLGTTMNMASELKTRPFPTFEKEEPFLLDYS